VIEQLLPVFLSILLFRENEFLLRLPNQRFSFSFESTDCFRRMCDAEKKIMQNDVNL
jgi:hypothetical protein